MVNTESWKIVQVKLVSEVAGFKVKLSGRITDAIGTFVCVSSSFLRLCTCFKHFDEEFYRFIERTAKFKSVEKSILLEDFSCPQINIAKKIMKLL